MCTRVFFTHQKGAAEKRFDHQFLGTNSDVKWV